VFAAKLRGAVEPRTEANTRMLIALFKTKPLLPRDSNFLIINMIFIKDLASPLWDTPACLKRRGTFLSFPPQLESCWVRLLRKSRIFKI
jgi:hypothetical protein